MNFINLSAVPEEGRQHAGWKEGARVAWKFASAREWESAATRGQSGRLSCWK